MKKKIKIVLSMISTALAATVVVCLANDRQTWGWIFAYWVVAVVHNVLNLV